MPNNLTLFCFVNYNNEHIYQRADNFYKALLEIAKLHELKCDFDVFSELAQHAEIEEAIRIFNVLVKRKSDQITTAYTVFPLVNQDWFNQFL